MKVAFDTNILVYGEGLNGAAKQAVVLKIVTSLPREQVILPLNVLGELFNVLRRKGRLSRQDARATAEAECRILLSEDMQDGVTWRGLTVVNPFVQPPSPLLQNALQP